MNKPIDIVIHESGSDSAIPEEVMDVIKEALRTACEGYIGDPPDPKVVLQFYLHSHGIHLDLDTGVATFMGDEVGTVDLATVMFVAGGATSLDEDEGEHMDLLEYCMQVPAPLSYVEINLNLTVDNDCDGT